MENELITISELSQKLKVPVSWLYMRTRQSGENSMPVIRLGKLLRFRYDDIERWLENEQQESDCT